MARRAYIAESDGKAFPTKGEAEAHDEEVIAARLSAVFQEKFAVFVSETDYEMPKTKAGEEALTAVLNAIKDRPLEFMEVMETVLPKQWQRKLRAKRSETSEKKPAKKKPASKKKTTKTKKAKSKKAGKEKPKGATTAPPPEEPKPDVEPVSHQADDGASPLPDKEPRYMVEERDNGCWAILDEGTELYDEFAGFDKDTALQAAGILNSGRGRDGWCEGDDGADLLRDRLIEEGWKDPMEQESTPDTPMFDPNPENVAFPASGEPTPEKDPEVEAEHRAEEEANFPEVDETPPPPPEEPPAPPADEVPPAPPVEETPPPPPEDELTPPPDLGPDEGWREDDDSPIPSVD